MGTPDVSAYTTQSLPVAAISPALRTQMCALYLANFDGSSAELFQRDLAAKDEGLLLWHGGRLAGFTLLQVYDARHAGREIRVVYSGDTIVDRDHWGQQKLAFAWIERIGQIKADSPDVPLYWFLLSKGHRTYKYLSAFAQTFHPHWSGYDARLAALADELATRKFGASWCRERGVVAFENSHGHLKPEIAQPSAESLAKPATRFFLERNPGYAQGEELVCVCELDARNMKPLAARIFTRALEAAVGA